jgi:hypothetical protein
MVKKYYLRLQKKNRDYESKIDIIPVCIVLRFAGNGAGEFGCV